MSGLYSELRRRNVFRVAIAYVLVAWILLQIADVLFPALTLPDWSTRLVAGLLILGFPLALFFAWAYELTPEGLKKEQSVDRTKSVTRQTGRKLDFVVIAVLTVAVGMFAADRFLWRDDGQSSIAVSDSKTIAVLPFVNMSADPANEYFSDGISEELLNFLAKIPELRVIGRTSSFQFKNRNEDLREIGAQLGVANLLEGSVRKSGDRVRITAQLIAVNDGARIWSDSFDRNLDDIFAVQDEIATAVVAALRVELLGESIPTREAVAVSDAYDAYLKGLFYYRKANQSDIDTALAYFREAINLDPNLAVAWEMVGSAYLNQTLDGTLPLAEGRKMAQEAMDVALELDSRAAGAHYQTGFRQMVWDWDWQGAQESMNAALAIEPNHSAALSGLSLLSAALGRVEQAVDLQLRSIRADPLRVASHGNLGFVYFASGQLDAAVEAIETSLEFAPDVVRAHYRIAMALLMQGDSEAALARIQRETGEQWRLAGMASIYHQLGQTEESDAALAELVEQFPGSAAAAIAKAYAFRGETDAAFEWLERAYEQHDPLLPWIRRDPLLASIRDDPRFSNLLERLNLPN